ncbi:hypothetical protein [Pseudomonas sp. PAGU 2196]|uniref:hypothetical protein n=1 Tax=Pseudomonas sp. PAGU 2196 TaxID=2793997 RepID=UPI001EE00372|nr:hypothetical protein [Pseudomonas sp. PAGU 2196]
MSVPTFSQMMQSSQPPVVWITGTPIPKPATVLLAGVENYGEILPSGLSVEDVETIWWTAASFHRFEYLWDELASCLDRACYDPGLGSFPIAFEGGESRYPAPVICLLQHLLSDWDISVNSSGWENLTSIYIMAGIWHCLTFEALRLCPESLLPPHLLELRLAKDLGL